MTKKEEQQREEQGEREQGSAGRSSEKKLASVQKQHAESNVIMGQ